MDSPASASSRAPAAHPFSSHRYHPSSSSVSVSSVPSLFAPTYFPSSIPAAGSAAASHSQTNSSTSKDFPLIHPVAAGDQLSSHPLLCVCEVCTCNLHHCPRTPAIHQPDSVDLLAKNRDLWRSTQQSDYTRHPSYGTARASGIDLGKSSISFDSNAPEKLESLSAASYRPYSVGHAREPYQPLKSTLTLIDPSANSEKDSVYTHDYKRHPLSAARPVTVDLRTSHVFTGDDGLTDETTHRQDFIDHLKRGYKTRKPMIPKPAVYAPGDEDRNFHTTSGQDFSRKPYSVREAMKPYTSPYMAMDSADEKLGKSANQSDFPDWINSGLYERRRPIEPYVSKFQTPDEDRDFMSTQKADYKRFQAAANRGKIAQNPFASSCSSIFPDDDKNPKLSESKANYQAFPDAKPAKLWRPNHVPPVSHEGEDATDYQSDYRRNFTSKQTERLEGGNPLRFQRSSLDFSGNDEDRDFLTETRANQRRWPWSVRENYKPKSTFIPMDQPFEGESETKSSFAKPVGAQPAQSAKPRPHSVLDQDDGRHFVTEHAYHYQQKQVDPCPALGLPDRDKKDRSGHVYYQRDQDTGRFVKTGIIKF